jgi:hypothetical protein
LRISSPIDLAAHLAATVPDHLHDGRFSSIVWLKDPRNVALKIGPDLAMFEWLGPQSYLGHCWMASRGRTALLHARAMLDDMTAEYGATLIRGEVPVSNRKMRLFAGWLGFEEEGEALRPWGRCTLMSYREQKNVPASATRVALPLAS